MKLYRLTVAVVAIASSACGGKLTNPGIPVEPVDFSVHGVVVVPGTGTLAPGQSLTLAASVDAGVGVTERSVTWTSSDTTIATVTTNGVVTAKAKVGNTTILATSKADPSMKGSSAILVAPVSLPLTNP